MISNSCPPPKSLEDLAMEIKGRALFYPSTNDILLNQDGSRAKYLVDLRSLLLDPNILKYLVQQFWDKYGSYKELQIASIELAGVSLMTAICLSANDFGCQANSIIIRKSRKKYGLQKVIEGELRQNIPTILIDDLVNSGSSIFKAIQTINEAGASVFAVFSVLDFNNPQKIRAFNKIKLEHTFLVSLSSIIESSEVLNIDIASYRTSFSFNPRTPYHKYLVFCRSNPVVEADCVYYGTDSSEMICLNKRTGNLIWKYSAIKRDYLKGIWSSPIIIGTKLCFGCYDGNLYLLEKDTGDVVWIFSGASFIGSSPEYSKDHELIYIGLEHALPGQQGSIAAVDLRSGEMRWEHRCHNFVHSTPLYLEHLKAVVCGSNDNDLVSLDGETGRLLWRTDLRGVCKMKPALSDDKKLLVVACTDKSIKALEADTGRIVWVYHTEFANWAKPLCAGNKVIVGSLDDKIHILDLNSGSLLGKIQTDGRLMGEPAIYNNFVYLGNNSGAVFEVDLGLMQIVGRYQLPDRVLSKIAYDAETKQFFAHTHDDRLFSWKKTNELNASQNRQ